MTLVEILVVIAIIGILAALALVGVLALMSRGPGLATKAEISLLENAIGKFETEKHFYPPSKIRLYPSITQYNPSDPLDKHSLYFIEKLWPSIGNFANVPWAGSTAIPNGVILEGDQCLVFFLGGFPNVVNGMLTVQGIPTDPTMWNPAAPDPQATKYFQFDLGRLASRGGNPFPSYLDYFKKQPYVYFSSNKRENGYFAGANTIGVSPYVKQATPPQYWNPSTFQIISAGEDGQFGPGGLWTPGAATQIAAGGKDDLTNFYANKMGVLP
jgi:prepilin-type N-terminal cleavage/methylation domain-containing protein